MTKAREDLKVFISRRSPTCDECQSELGEGSWICLAGEKGALCLSCADLDHLMFLPSGDAALTRRSKKYSTLSAVVLKWSRARQRYERQGLLVEEAALSKAEEECLSDADSRERRRLREAEKREELDRGYVNDFAREIRAHYPQCPEGHETVIAEHACRKYSGRVGRSAMAKALDARAVELAVAAHIRHAFTSYDELLIEGIERRDARGQVAEEVRRILEEWKTARPGR